MNSRINKQTIQFVMYYLNRKFRDIFEGIYVNDPELDSLKQLLTKKDPVILLPVYKSYLDLPILLYTLFNNGIDIPFTIGNIEDTPRITPLEYFIKLTGYL
jgi:glycerol-3-phosphate O-acyltransferase